MQSRQRLRRNQKHPRDQHHRTVRNRSTECRSKENERRTSSKISKRRDIVPINHAYGCGVAINAPEAKVPIRALRNLAKHPNFGGQLMVVGLGCEKFTVQMLLDEADITPENVIILQEQKGFDAMVDAS